MDTIHSVSIQVSTYKCSAKAKRYKCSIYNNWYPISFSRRPTPLSIELSEVCIVSRPLFPDQHYSSIHASIILSLWMVFCTVPVSRPLYRFFLEPDGPPSLSPPFSHFEPSLQARLEMMLFRTAIILLILDYALGTYVYNKLDNVKPWRKNILISPLACQNFRRLPTRNPRRSGAAFPHISIM